MSVRLPVFPGVVVPGRPVWRPFQPIVALFCSSSSLLVFKMAKLRKKIGIPYFFLYFLALPLENSEKSVIFARILYIRCACGEIGRRARLRIWWFRPCRFESYQAHRCSFTKKATTYSASPPGKPCKLLPLFVQLPWKAAVRRYFNAYSTLT